MAYSFVSNVAAASTNGDGFTTAGMNSSGADLLVAVLSSYQGEIEPTLTDSNTNTWVGLTAYAAAGNSRVRIFYAENASVGSGHTFTVSSGVNAFAALFVVAFSGSDLTAPQDQANGNNSSTTTSIQPGSVTPAEDNELVITGLSMVAALSAAIDSGFSLTDAFDNVAAQHLGGGLAYKIQGVAAAVNPTWSYVEDGTEVASAATATFKAAAGGGGGGTTPHLRLRLLGVG